MPASIKKGNSSNIPVVDHSKNCGSDSDTLRSSRSTTPLSSPLSSSSGGPSTRLPSYQHQRSGLPSRKCASNNVTPISSPLIPKLRGSSSRYSSNNHHKQQQQQQRFSKEVIETSAQLIKDIDLTLTHLSRQYYSDNNNCEEPISTTCISNSNSTSTSNISTSNNNNGSGSPRMLTKLKLKKTSPSPSPASRHHSNQKLPQHQQLKFPQKFFLSEQTKEQLLTDRDSGISSSKETWGTEKPSPATDKLTAPSDNKRGSGTMSVSKQPRLPQPPPRISSLKCPQDVPQLGRDLGSESSQRHASKADKRRARELFASVKQRDEQKTAAVTGGSSSRSSEKRGGGSCNNNNNSEESLSCSDADNLKTSGYISDGSSYLDPAASAASATAAVSQASSSASSGSGAVGMGTYAQKMQQRFHEGLLAVEESLRMTQQQQSVPPLLQQKRREISSSTTSSSSGSDDIEEYLRELSSRLSSSTSLNPSPRKTSAPTVVSGSSPGRARRQQQQQQQQQQQLRQQQQMYERQLEKYANELEPAADFDITSSCSMDLLTGKASLSEHGGDSAAPKRGSVDYRPLGQGRTRVSRRDMELLEAAGPTPATIEDALVANGHIRAADPVLLPGDNSHYRAMSLPGRPSRMRSHNNGVATSSVAMEMVASAAMTTPAQRQQQHSVYYDVPTHQRPGYAGGRNTNHYASGSCTPSNSLMHVRLPYATVSSHGNGCNGSYGNGSHGYGGSIVRPSTSTSSLGGRGRDDGANGEEIYEGLGSRLSLLSSGSYRSLNEERQASEIRRLRRELEIAQQKVKSLTGQLSNNGNLVSAFESSLQSMSLRLHKFATTSESKENELTDLKNTIQQLKKQSSAASPIQGEQTSPKIYAASSLTSLSSNSNSTDKTRSDGSLKKSSWLRNSLGRAFRKKSSSTSKDDGSSESINELHRKQHNCTPMSVSTPPPPASSSSSSQSCSLLQGECDSGLATRLRRELEEKEARLTDVQLDALSRSHQLEQLRDLLTKMRYEMSSLKADNCRLQGLMTTTTATVSNAASTTNIATTGAPEASPETTRPTSSASSGRNKFDLWNSLVRELEPCLVLQVTVAPAWPGSGQPIPIGRAGLAASTSWAELEGQLRRLLREFVLAVEPGTGLGVTTEAIYRYRINEEPWVSVSNTGSMRPLTSPLAAAAAAGAGNGGSMSCGVGGSVSAVVLVELRPGLDGPALQSLLPKPLMARYLALLQEHRKVIVCGAPGTGKSALARLLAEQLAGAGGRILSLPVDRRSASDLRAFMAALADQLAATSTADSASTEPLPAVVILDNLHFVSSFADVFSSFLAVHNSRSPFVIGTMSEAHCPPGVCNLQLHHNFRWILLANHLEPVRGFLGRFLRRRLLLHRLHSHLLQQPQQQSDNDYDQVLHVAEWLCVVWQHLNRFIEAHASAAVTLPPRLFLDCPLQSSSQQQRWFLDLWNHSLAPYLLQAVRDALSSQGGRSQLCWEDPADWVVRSWPWPPTPIDSADGRPGLDSSCLLRLRPEDVGFESYQLKTVHDSVGGPMYRQTGAPGGCLVMPGHQS